ncbi:aminotransferase class I/II-fold pyridoxal phosphate-dependent enzyme [bacterium]|nr:MAG: aminotransferase class I/II-fold pyridoxal phosphate-dependent enzyme [bacterium]RIK62374.1 MAG: 8-amino-7-oxononanoate synthase [Planctomycetota bacterium]
MHNLNAWCSAEIESLRARSLFHLPKVHSGPAGARTVVNGKKVIQLSNNSYLGLSTHPKVVEAAKKAIDQYGVGSGAVRPISGTMDLHNECEERLARFKKTESCLLFQSGFTANVGVVSTLAVEGDHIISDELNHASIIDGCRLSKASRAVYRHKDYGHLRELLREARGPKNIKGKILVVTDGVFSMDGDVADLKACADACDEFDAITMVDDAHATGVLGAQGRGTVDEQHMHERWALTVGTLSKAIPVVGGYFAGPRVVKEYLIAKARPFLFSCSAPPPVVAAVIACIEVMETEPQHLKKLWDNTKFFKDGLRKLGFNTGDSTTPVTPVIVGQGAKAAKFSEILFNHGVFAQGIYFPMVAEEKSRVRTIVSAAHSRDDLQEALDVFKKCGKELGLI